jgi:[NiFe] hydrogenase diaphorase moiety large subunit
MIHGKTSKRQKKNILQLHPKEISELKKYLNSLSVGPDITKNKGFLVMALHKTQQLFKHIPHEIQLIISKKLHLTLSDVSALVSFYHFFSEKPLGKNVIYLSNDIVDKMFGFEKVAEVFKDELEIDFEEITKDEKFSLHSTSCIGMCDQAPAAIINNIIITNLTPKKAKNIINQLKNNITIEEIVALYSDDNNTNPLICSMVNNNIKKKGEIIFSDYIPGNALRIALNSTPINIINKVTVAQLRGRGGAGFPAGEKWNITRDEKDTEKRIICNADEGEPGTFKDRVVLTERPDLLFEGMTIAGYAIGADTGILYLRQEYEYLHKYLEDVLTRRRKSQLLGNVICPGQNINEFKFDIRIQMGAGAYICGEESALISSCEGQRGVPKKRPPFPVQRGYFQHPTSVNNIETYCCTCRIIENGDAWFSSMGTDYSKGTKLLSISGDCEKPGVYELPYGIPVSDILRLTGAINTYAVQVGGPSGKLINSKNFHRKICFEDLPTGGAITIFNKTRSLPQIVISFMKFFRDESCGKCTPCRVGISNILDILFRICAEKGELHDLDLLRQIGTAIKKTSFCGLGQSAANPVLSSLEYFYEEYEKHIKH